MKIIKSIILLFITSAGLVILQGCCDKQAKIVGNGAMSIIDDNYRILDTISNSFTILIEPEIEVAGTLHDIQLGLMTSAYATSCDYEFTNRLLTDEIVITSTRDFIFEGETISANSNFINLAGITSYIIEIGETYQLIISFDSSFIENAEFVPGDYTLSVDVTTEEGIILQNSALVYVEL